MCKTPHGWRRPLASSGNEDTRVCSMLPVCTTSPRRGRTWADPTWWLHTRFFGGAWKLALGNAEFGCMLHP